MSHIELYPWITQAIAAMREAHGKTRDMVENELGRRFLKAAEEGNANKVSAFIEQGFPADYRDPETGETVLHVAAASRARKVLKSLIAHKGCNFLIRDNMGRLPSELAYLHGSDPALARLLGVKERKQAESEGTRLTRRPSVKLKKNGMHKNKGPYKSLKAIIRDGMTQGTGNPKTRERKRAH